MKDIDRLREGVVGLARESSLSLRATREAFASGVPPLQTVGSGSVESFISRFGSEELPELVRSTANLGLRGAKVGTVLRPPRPELDYIELDSDPTYGVLDSFYARVVVSFSLLEANSIRFLRLLRADNGKIDVSKPSFSAMIDGLPVRASRTNPDPIAISAFRVAAIGVGNQLTDLIADDPLSPLRNVRSAATASLPEVVNTNRRGSPAALVSIENADRSVVEDLSFSINRRMTTAPEQIALPLTVGAREGLNVLQGSAVVRQATGTSKGDSERFREVLRSSAQVNRRQVGGFFEVPLYDPSVVFGRSYSYCVVAVDSEGNQSPRSRIVTLEVRRQNPPATPTVSYSVITNRPRFSIRVSGKFIDHVEVYRRGGIVPGSSRLIGADGSIVKDGEPTAVGAYHHIGDIGIGIDGSTTFVDSGVIPGQDLSYRFYSVDSFGTKSQKPFECEIRIPDLGQSVPLAIPSITAEQGTGPGCINISVRCDDPRVTFFIVKRREIGRGEMAYHEPNDPAYFRLGSPTDAKRSRSRNGPALGGGSKAWSGVHRSSRGSAKLIDTCVSYDRTYQYIVQAVDSRGNLSYPSISRMVKVAVKPVAPAPVNLNADVLVTEGAPVGVMISWTGGTDDFSPNELIGDQDVLTATLVRSVYQVERRETSESIWEVMPAVTGSSFIDPVSSAKAPEFRPAYAQLHSQYDYRVISMQSGGFVSNYTDPVRVTVTPEPPALGSLRVRSTDSAIRPCHVVLSWDYHGQFVDGWQIERAVTNKLYAARISSMQSEEARSLDYRPYSIVNRESSRAHGLSTDGPDVDPRVFAGNRFFIDQDVTLDNAYFYRVRTIDADSFGEWSYGGIVLRDSPHDRKLLSTLSEAERILLSRDPRPISRRSR